MILAVLTAVAWGFMLLIYGTTGKENPIWAVFDTRVTSAVVLAAYVLVTGRGLSLKGQNVPVLAAIGLLLAIANFLFIVAARVGYLSVTSILGSLSPVVVTAVRAGATARAPRGAAVGWVRGRVRGDRVAGGVRVEVRGPGERPRGRAASAEAAGARMLALELDLVLRRHVRPANVEEVRRVPAGPRL